MDFEKLCAERYSLRKYADRPVEAEKLEKVLRQVTMHRRLTISSRSAFL